MKRLFFIGILLFVIAACSHDRSLPPQELPARVPESFQNHFPGATGIEWLKYNLDYQANFKIQDTEFYALFDETGELYIHQKQISSVHIDKEILKKVKAAYPDFSIDEMYEINDRGKIMYEFEMDKNFFKEQTVFFMEGKIFQQ